MSEDVFVPGEETFFERTVYSKPWLEPVEPLLRKYLELDVDREELAARDGLEVGRLLKTLNATAPVSEPIGYRFKSIPFEVRSMAGPCDDCVGDRYGRFGDPITLRMYMTDECGLPARLFEVADFNFMDAGFPYYVGYVYGTVYGDTYFVSGIQSDLAQRYTYLFLGAQGPTSVREGEGIRWRTTEDLVEEYRAFVPLLRRTFQRRWIDVLLAGIVAWAERETNLSRLALQQYRLTPEEQSEGHVVRRIYERLPARLPCTIVRVATERAEYIYNRTTFADIRALLGPEAETAGAAGLTAPSADERLRPGRRPRAAAEVAGAAARGAGGEDR